MPDVKYSVDVDTKGATRALNGLKSALVAIGAALVTKEIIDITARFEDMRSSLDAVTGSVQAGGEAFSFISKFATQTQFGIEELSKSFIQLKAGGLDPSTKLLTLFTDTAAATTDQLGSLEAMTKLFSRAAAGAGVTVEDLDILAERGIPVYKILAERIDVTRGTLTEFAKEAGNTKVVLDTLTDGLNASFGGETAKRAGNLSTVISNFKIAVSNLAFEFGSGLAPAIKEIITGITTFIAENDKLARTIGTTLGNALIGIKDLVVEMLETMGLLKAGGLEEFSASITTSLANFLEAFSKGIDSAVNMLIGVINGLQSALVAISKFTPGFDAQFREAGQSSEDFKNKLISDLEVLKERQKGFTFADGLAGMFGQNIVTATAIEISKIEAQLQSLEDGSTVIFDQIGQNFNSASKFTDPFIISLRETAEELQKSAAAAQNTGEVLEDYNAHVDDYTAAQQAANRATAQARLLQDQLNESISAYNTEAEKRISSAADSADLSAFQGLQRTLEEIRIEEQRLAEAAKARIKEQFSAADPDILREQLANIDAVTQRTIEARQEAARQIEQNAQRFRTAEQAKIDAAKAAEEAAKNAQKSFAEGWNEAFASYKKNAMDAGQGAARLFNKTTKSMEDSIVDFAKTGKFQFKDLVNTILEELLRSQIQRLIASTFGAFGGGGGGFNPFSGFYANGGLIPSGKFGVVGEKGPELISGPANITPLDGLGGGGTQVIYNINAVDAPSFKSMIARDPGFIHAVAQQGARKVPIRR